MNGKVIDKEPAALTRIRYLIHFHVPLASLLPVCELLLPLDALGLTHSFEHLQNARHHALKTAEVAAWRGREEGEQSQSVRKE